MTRAHRTALAATLLFTIAPSLFAQQFGSAVAISGEQVLVQKPSAGQGPATVFVFARTAGGAWEAVEQLTPVGGGETGEGFSRSLAATDGYVFVASGDPNGRWGAHVFRWSGSSWTPVGRLPLSDATDVNPEQPGGAVDLGTVMRILRPPQRIVAADGDLTVTALVGNNAAAAGVRIFERRNGEWQTLGKLEAADVGARDQFGTALAVRDGRIVVGAPRHGNAGAVFVFEQDTNGQWTQEATLTAELPMGAAFGSAVAYDGEVVVVGAPGNRTVPGAVIAFARDPADGTWHETSRATPSGNAPGARYGAALALFDGELWVGAPGAYERRGRVFRFVRDDTDQWRAAESPDIPGTEPGFTLGIALAFGERFAVVGAPGANGGMGRAAVLTRSDDGGWADATWLESGGDLERITGTEVRCENGAAAGFACSDVDLLAYLPVDALGGDPGEGVSDLWGWTDSETNREYALVGRSGGLAIVDVTNPVSPVFMGIMPASRSGVRDIKVYRNHAFMTGDGAGNHGLLVFDLTRLRSVVDTPATFEPDAVYDQIASAHNLVINTESGFAFPVGASGAGQTCGGGLHMVDIRDPKNPTFAGCYTDTEGLLYQGRTHDAQCVVYAGPDPDYTGREICFASNETALRVVDVTDKANPTPISRGTYPGLSYVHQGWLTDDQQYFYLDDELDELVGNSGGRTRTIIWDVADLDDPVMVGEFVGSTPATDHNLYIKGDRMYQANYSAGFRVIDISDRRNPVEMGFFDTTPYEGNPPGFNGAWSAYPYFASGTVIVSSMREGLFILRPRPALVP